jgi:hypothetical protein
MFSETAHEAWRARVWGGPHLNPAAGCTTQANRRPLVVDLVAMNFALTVAVGLILYY